MIEKDVAEISQLFGLDKTIVEASEKDGTLSVRIKDSLEKTFIPKTQHEKFKENHKSEVELAYYNDLVEKSAKGDIPQDLYKNIKGSVLQQKERELAKKFDVKDYTNFDDLIEKGILKTSANGKQNPEYETKIKELQEANLRLEAEKKEAINTVKAEFKGQMITRDLEDFVNKVPHDFSKYKPDEVTNATVKIKNVLKSVFTGDGYKLDYDEKARPVVIGKDGKVLKNTATLEPLSPLDVMTSLAKEYGQPLLSPDRGGQGGNSSQQSSTGFTDIITFKAWCESKGIDPFSKEATKAWTDSGLRKAEK